MPAFQVSKFGVLFCYYYIYQVNVILAKFHLPTFHFGEKSIPQFNFLESKALYIHKRQL